MSDPPPPAFHVGQRVHAAADRRRIGTVRYVGAVIGHPGDWVGVDWDDSASGKHDGAVDGVRYFSARSDQSGSLARPRSLSPGISLLDALHRRYRGGSDTTKEEEDEMYVLSTSNRRVSIQLVGKEKVQAKLNNIEELVGVSLSYMGVSSIDSPHEVKALLPNLKELDMTGNLLSKWQDVWLICEALPTLQVINLTCNQLESEIPPLPPLRNILVLVLNNCGITCSQVEKLKDIFPAIEELHLMGNHLANIPAATFDEGFDSLRLLNLEDNCIGSWDEILKLSQLKCLEQLHLNKNALKYVHYPDCPRTSSSTDYQIQDKHFRPFEKLQCLLLGCNEIQDLASVDSLNFFPGLVDIRLSDNPVTDPSKGGVPRFVLVARLAKVRILNGSEVSARERKESEIRYVRLVMAKMQSNDLAEIERLHPRFGELKTLHGIEDEKPSTGTVGPQKMASGFLNITFKCVGSSMGEKPPLTKKLPPQTSVGKLKILCESFFKLKGIKPRLFIQEEGSPLPQLLDDEMASLLDLGCSTEATILVDEEC